VLSVFRPVGRSAEDGFIPACNFTFTPFRETVFMQAHDAAPSNSAMMIAAMSQAHS
jgi:hypothetical protein